MTGCWLHTYFVGRRHGVLSLDGMIKVANPFRFFDPGRFLGYFLKTVALLYFLGAFVHFGNLVGFGEVNPVKGPRIWLMLDGFYLVLDTFVGVGLWRRRTWGVLCLFVAVVSQLVLYLGFPSHFATTPEQEEAISGSD